VLTLLMKEVELKMRIEFRSKSSRSMADTIDSMQCLTAMEGI